MANTTGKKFGGRKPGTPNKDTETVKAILDRLGCSPVEGMALIASGNVPCGVCHGKGKTRYKVEDAKGNIKVGERLCESCYGTLKEHIAPDLRGKMYAELAYYIYPKRKPVDDDGQADGPIEHIFRWQS